VPSCDSGNHDGGNVTFQWKDYRSPGREKSRQMTLGSGEFIRRFLLHTLPHRFPRIRHFGFLANRHRRQRLALCRQLLLSEVTGLLPGLAACHSFSLALDPPFRRCPKCTVGILIRVGFLPAYRWPARPPDTS